MSAFAGKQTVRTIIYNVRLILKADVQLQGCFIGIFEHSVYVGFLAATPDPRSGS
jgi:hypothetical protein